MEKQLGWACKLDGMESLGFSRARQRVLARLMETQIYTGLLALWLSGGEGSEEGWWPLSTFLYGKKFSLSSLLEAKHFDFSLYATSAFEAATSVLELRGSETKSVWGFFKGNCLGLQKFLPTTQSPLVFASRSYLLGTVTLGCGPGVGPGPLTHEISILNIYPPHVEVRLACSACPPLLPV